MRRETSEFSTQFSIDGAEAVVESSIQASMRGVDLDHPASAEVLAHDVTQALDKAGFEIVRKRQASEPQPWVLAQVTPGDVKVSRDLEGSGNLQVVASATATLVQWGGRGPGAERKISVSTVFKADENTVCLATKDAMAISLCRARDAARGFAEAAAAAQAEVDAPSEEAA